MSRGDEPNADPSGSLQAELAAGLTGLRRQLDTAIDDFEAVRSEAEAKVLALHSHLKQISAEMSTLEAAISSAVAASAEAPAQTAIAGAAGDNEAAHELIDENEAAMEVVGDGTPTEAANRYLSYDYVGSAEAQHEAAGENEAVARASGSTEAGHEAKGENEAAENTARDNEAAERAAAENEAAERAAAESEAAERAAADEEPAAAANHTAGSRGAAEYRPAADHAPRKGPATAADIALAMLEDLALESPTSHVSEQTVAGPNNGQPAFGTLVGDRSTQSTISSSVDPLLRQEFAEYFEPATAPPPAPEPQAQPDEAERIRTDDWA